MRRGAVLQGLLELAAYGRGLQRGAAVVVIARRTGAQLRLIRSVTVQRPGSGIAAVTPPSHTKILSVKV